MRASSSRQDLKRRKKDVADHFYTFCEFNNTPLSYNINIMGRKINICFAGDSGVGKSSILKRIQKGEFDEYASPTIGFDHYFEKKNIQGIDTTVCLIDTGGQDKFRAMAPSYFRDADGIFLVFSLEEEEENTIMGLEYWMNTID